MAYKDKEKQNAWLREYRRKNPAKCNARKNEQRERNAVFLFEYKNAHPCTQCNESDSCCLDFHHKIEKKSTKSVSWMAVQGWSLDIIKTEIDKCIILCSNCHRKLHCKRKNIAV